MTFSIKRITLGSIEDIPEIALAGTIEIAAAQPQIVKVGEAVFEQKLALRNRIKIYAPKLIEDLPFKYPGTYATSQEFLARIDDYLLSRGQYFAEVKSLSEGGKMSRHSIKGILYKLA